jgi:hypothetical protein
MTLSLDSHVLLHSFWLLLRSDLQTFPRPNGLPKMSQLNPSCTHCYGPVVFFKRPSHLSVIVNKHKFITLYTTLLICVYIKSYNLIQLNLSKIRFHNINSIA